MNDFENKTVVITGGATGIGFALAKQFGAHGANVLIAGRRRKCLVEAAAVLKGMGVRAEYKACDVTRLRDVQNLADYAWAEFGTVDVLVNNAGGSIPGNPMIKTLTSDVDKLFRTNFFGVWHGCQVFAKRFIAQSTPAAIYNMGSEASLFLCSATSAPYMASKHAVLALTESLRVELPNFIDVGLICPGIVQTEISAKAMGEDVGMNADTFAEIALKQMLEGEFYIVSHPHGVVHVNSRHKEIANAYKRYAPRYKGDDTIDFKTLIATYSE